MWFDLSWIRKSAVHDTKRNPPPEVCHCLNILIFNCWSRSHQLRRSYGRNDFGTDRPAYTPTTWRGAQQYSRVALTDRWPWLLPCDIVRYRQRRPAAVQTAERPVWREPADVDCACALTLRLPRRIIHTHCSPQAWPSDDYWLSATKTKRYGY